MTTLPKDNLKVLCAQAQQMLQHFHKFMFLNTKNRKVDLDYNGQHLKQNVYNEWMISNSITCDDPVFHFSSLNRQKLIKSFNEVQSIFNSIPCNIVCVNVSSEFGAKSEHSHLNIDSTDTLQEINGYFKHCTGNNLQRYIFCTNEIANEYFLKIQRERLLWWKKFSTSPDRFSLSIDHASDETETKVAVIKAKFPWGTESVENINQSTVSIGNQSGLQGERGAKPEVIIASETTLEKATLTFLCDSYEGFEDPKKKMLGFHHKLAPYKVAFSVVAESREQEKNLKDLARLLSKSIRNKLISVLFLPDACSTPLEAQITQYDSIGIPYTIIMNENTLKTGFLSLRSRDTTLEEQSHVSLIVSYVEKLMKNY